MTKSNLFQNNPTLLDSPYRVQSSVSLSIFREFLSALEGNSIKITPNNFAELHRLSQEFGFTEISSQLSEFRSSIDFESPEASDSRARISALEEASNHHSHVISMLQNKLTSLISEVSSLRSASVVIQALSEEVSALKTQITPPPPFLPSADSPPEVPPYPFPFPFPPLAQFPSAAVLPPPQSLPIDSRIISGFPEIFADFRGKQISLLWRGSRDGFRAQTFHRRCDWHANTLTVILDTKGNIFGGFTPVEWESRTSISWVDTSNCYKADDSLKSFVFTLKNPHNKPARRFALKAETKNAAIVCDSKWGPSIGYLDIRVWDNCNANTDSSTFLGCAYTNDTGLDGQRVFTGSATFKVKEIEVFEIAA
jgi:hypothetical protein